MRQEIILHLDEKADEITIPYSTHEDIIYIQPADKHVSIKLGVSNFPVFVHSQPELVAIATTLSIGINVLTENTVNLLDPFKIKDIDLKTLEELNIYQNKDYYSVN